MKYKLSDITFQCACYGIIAIMALIIMGLFTKCRGAELPQLEYCLATYYSDFHHGHTTANGQKYCPELFSCASAYPEDIGKDLLIHHNGEKVLVPCNDRLTNPKALERGVRIDLSRKAVEELTGGKACTIEIIIERIQK